MPRLVSERHRLLLSLLQERREVDLPSLVRELDVSETTLRRDLERLERAGQLVRTFGGARRLEPASLLARTFGEKQRSMQAEKERIARAAAALVEPGMIVALDSGTTIWRVAAALKEKAPLRILTSALAPVEELGSLDGFTIHLAGGKFRRENLDFTGTATVASYRELHADIAFVGADSYLPGRGAFSLDEASASVAAAVADCADRRVVVVDHTKFGARGCCLVIPSHRVDVLVTDDGLDASMRRRLVSEPYTIQIAGT